MANHDDRAPSDPLEDSDLDAEGEEADEEYEIYTKPAVIIPKVVNNEEVDSDVDAEGEEEDDEDVDAAGSTDDAEAESDDSSEPEENTSWQAESDAEEGDDKTADTGLCM
jgi:hypothetical protein